MNNSYYNTTARSGEELRDYERQAVTQEDRILRFFTNNHNVGGWTPSEVNNIVMPEAPPTSVRRAITNLTNQGQLVKTSRTRQGPYGRPECVWKLARPDETEPKELLI